MPFDRGMVFFPLSNLGFFQGDSGGPLVSKVNGVYELVGIVSGSDSSGCNVKGAPNIFVNVFCKHFLAPPYF